MKLEGTPFKTVFLIPQYCLRHPTTNFKWRTSSIWCQTLLLPYHNKVRKLQLRAPLLQVIWEVHQWHRQTTCFWKVLPSAATNKIFMNKCLCYCFTLHYNWMFCCASNDNTVLNALIQDIFNLGTLSNLAWGNRTLFFTTLSLWT